MRARPGRCARDCRASVLRRKVGEWLRAGDRVGFVYDGFSGEQCADVKTPAVGLLAGLRRQPLLCEGDLLARILTREELGAVAETYLMGHGQ